MSAEKLHDNANHDNTANGESLLIEDWRRALHGCDAARGAWHIGTAGAWIWQSDGVRVNRAVGEWTNLQWRGEQWTPATDFVLEMTVEGRAQAAGFGFGDYRDFLTELHPDMGARHLQLEVDSSRNRWLFRVDGQVMNRCWWDAGIHSAADILAGQFTLKARGIQEVAFRDLAIHCYASAPDLSVIITCSRFLQRLRVTLRNWCSQTLLPGTIEILVVDPQSPDGTQEHLAAVARSYPDLRLRTVSIPAQFATNKGVMINRAGQVAQGTWVWLTDADCLFAPDAAARVLDDIAGREPRLFYCRRQHLNTQMTSALLAGKLDGREDWHTLAETAHARPPDSAPLGYTQIVPRALLQTVRYREDVRHFAQTDNVFVADCERRGIGTELIEHLACLHLNHPFAWYGTRRFL